MNSLNNKYTILTRNTNIHRQIRKATSWTKTT